MFLFQVSNSFHIKGKGLILLPGIGNNYVPVGTIITIIKPDKSKIETIITSVFFDNLFPITINESFSMDDVPVGSTVWANKSIDYDLSHYNLIEKKIIADNCRIVLQHKIDYQFFKILSLSNFVGMIDNIDSTSVPVKLRIDQSNSSYALDLSLQFKDQRIKNYSEVLIFLDSECVRFVFRSAAKEITYTTEKH